MTAIVSLYLPEDTDRARPYVERVNASSEGTHRRVLDKRRWHRRQFGLPANRPPRTRPRPAPLRLMGNKGNPGFSPKAEKEASKLLHYHSRGAIRG